MLTPRGVSDLARGWWGIILSEHRARQISNYYEKSGQLKRVQKDQEDGEHITGDGIFAWLKNRLLEIDAIGRAGCCGSDPCHATATLHVGFVFIAETDEMLATLRREPVDDGKDSTARSKFASVAEVQDVHAVDSLASRVTGVDRVG